MSKPYFFILLFLIFGCKNQASTEDSAEDLEQKNVLENLTFEIDTVMIDMGEDMVDFSLGMIRVPSPDSRWYYIKNGLKIQKIDLDQLSLIDTIYLEKDGPNSPGGAFFSFQALKGNQFFFPNMNSPSIINSQGIKIKNWKLTHDEIVKGTSAEPFSIINRIQYNPDLGQLYSLPLDYQTSDYFLLALDSMGHRITLKELSHFQEMKEFTVKSDYEMKSPFLFLHSSNNQVIISNSFENGLYHFDPQTDSLIYREFPLEIVPLKKTGEIRNKVGSTREFEEELKKLNHQISFHNFLWDEKSHRYYRFASRAISFNAEGWPTGFEVFLMTHSKEMELKGEQKLEGKSTIPNGSFFKDGKLWAPINVEDELGFVIFTFNF